MKKYLFTLIMIPVFWGIAGCGDALLTPSYENTIQGNYDAFCSEYAMSYGAFQAKNINWDSLCTVYGASIHDTSGNEDLYTAVTGLLNEINDGHADINAPGIGYFRSWNRRGKSYFFDLNTQDLSYVSDIQDKIMETYMSDRFQSLECWGWRFFYGLIPYGSLNIIYVCIPSFSMMDFPYDLIDTAIDSANKTDGLIVDLRWNGGGTTEAFVGCLNRFAHEEKVFLRSRWKTGPKPDDFSDLSEHCIHPHENCLRDKPVVILQNAYSASSSEHLILGMLSQDNVTLVGDTTCGAFSSVNEKMLPNGWKMRFGSQVIHTPDGDPYPAANGNYIEGLGIAPDIFVRDNYNACLTGNDPVLNAALRLF